MRTGHPIGIDLFCGAGGMSLGFEQAGFEIVAAVDASPIHIDTHKRNFPKCKTICTDISSLNGEKLLNIADLKQKQLDVLFGGPPCQGFSMAGKRRSNDPRSLLFLEFSRLIKETMPLYFVVENVAGLIAGKTKTILEQFINEVIKAGYIILEPVRILDASEFGVPQQRKRLFIIGCLNGLQLPDYPSINVGESSTTVWDAIGDLPNVDDYHYLLTSDVYMGELGLWSEYSKTLRGLDEMMASSNKFREKRNGLSGCSRVVHSPEVIKRFSETIPGTCEPISRFYRLASQGVSNTIRAGTDRTHGGFTAPRPIHPIYPRCITVREAARLQSFPDWFTFHPTKWHGFREVGNSVPPLLAQTVAAEVLKCIYRLRGETLIKKEVI